MTIEFTDATRSISKARIALTGPSGAGKTYTMLALGTHLARREGGELAVIDTERGKSSMYAGLNGWQFKVTRPQAFSPASLTEHLAVCAGHGFPVVAVDSWSHYWSGVDGMLEQVDKRAGSGNKFAGWKEARPDERRMIDALVSYPGHVIVTLRVATAYVVEANDKGKQVPKKIGLKPEQREGMDYEFDVVGDLDLSNTMTISKTRLPMLTGQSIHQPGEELAATIADWMADGEDVPGPLAYRAEALDPDATFEGLRELRDRVTAAGLMGAPVTDGDGNPTLLGNLIAARGRELQPVRGVA
ncbi:AAA family ATPase [Pseudonocardia sp. NPDC049635]|uniref:AAA family ATPase n=1 Tax=Pseudonocardia sp. NPDC049635 TaxID=3155506 RepID=UPI0033F0A685